MSLYEDIVARGLAGNERARLLEASPARIRELAALLRDAHAGGTPILHCAWCERIRIDDEWLAFEAVGTGQNRIAADLVRRSTHGICPTCFDRVDAEAATQRGLQRR